MNLLIAIDPQAKMVLKGILQLFWMGRFALRLFLIKPFVLMAKSAEALPLLISTPWLEFFVRAPFLPL